MRISLSFLRYTVVEIYAYDHRDAHLGMPTWVSPKPSRLGHFIDVTRKEFIAAKSVLRTRS